jgi:hypothetical protein
VAGLRTRNAVAASSAFVVAVLAVGKAMPRELRITLLGKLAAVPSALNCRSVLRVAPEAS